MMIKRRGRTSKKATNQVGARLKSILAEHKLSQRRAASLAQVSASVMDSWVHGAVPSDLQAVKRLCDTLGVDFTWLLTGEHSRTQNIPTLSEIFEEVGYFDGLCRIRIDRLVPRKGSKEEVD